MTWGLLLGLAAIVFLNRYVFLEPRVAIRLPRLLKHMLNYAAPCLLAAICMPIIFYDASGLWRGLSSNAYFYASLVCCVLAYITRNVLVSLILSVAVFYVLMYVIGII